MECTVALGDAGMGMAEGSELEIVRVDFTDGSGLGEADGKDNSTCAGWGISNGLAVADGASSMSPDIFSFGNILLTTSETRMMMAPMTPAIFSWDDMQFPFFVIPSIANYPLQTHDCGKATFVLVCLLRTMMGKIIS
jgi:hypothetical protein